MISSGSFARTGNDTDVPERIQKLLKIHTGGLSISDISRYLKIHRNTASKFLEILHKSGKIEMRIIGNSKIFYPGKNVPLSTILGYTKEGILILDQRDAIIHVNHRFCSMFGLERDEIRDANLSELPGFLYEQFTNNPEERDDRQNQLRMDGIYQTEMTDSNGGSRMVSVSIVNTLLTTGGDGRVIIIEDITDRKEIEDSLSTAYWQLEQSFDRIATPVFIFDNNRKIIVWNKAMEKMTGYSAGDMIGTHKLKQAYQVFSPHIPVLPEIIHLSARDRFRKYPHVVKIGNDIFMEAFIPDFKNDADILIWAKLSPFQDKNGNILGMIQVFRDMTYWKMNSDSIHQYR